MLEVLQKGNPLLEEIAKEVPLESIFSPKIKNIISQMKEILRNTDDAIALAAPQIGESVRIFIISKKIFGECEDKDDLIFINPTIIKTSKEKKWAEEGCLSVRGVYGEVERFSKATIKAYDEEGKSFTFGGSGLLAQAFQHETDHLNGILFTEKTRNTREDK
ncbi:MAG: peptide deformylase [Candidatus Pacebacteria bacterium]|nr:peptide deformylase [Candidatus Paceibacterota bacterium]